MVECTGNATYYATKGKPNFLRKFHTPKVIKAVGATKGKGVMTI
jgi:phosphoribosylamine-glycine ligase